MENRPVGARILLTDKPKFRVANGLAHIRLISGEQEWSFSAPIAGFMEALRQAGRECADWQGKQAEVVPIKGKVRG